MKSLLTSDDINLNLYAVYIIKYYLKKNDYSDNCILFLTEQINNDYLLLFSILLNKGNKKLSFEILIILINITYTKEGEMLFGEDENIILNLANFLGNNKNDVTMLYFGLILIKHITCKNSLVRQILQNFKIIDFLNEIYEKFILDSHLIEEIILCLGHFINSRFSKNKDILCSIKIIKSQLNKVTPIQTLLQYVYILYNSILYKDSVVCKKMIDEKMHEILMELFPFEKDETFNFKINKKNNHINDINIKDNDSKEKEFQNLRILILKILGILLSIEDDNYIQKIIDSGISQFLNRLLKLSDIKIIKNVFYCIYTICCGTYGQIANLYDNNTISLSLIVAKDVYETIISNNQFIDKKTKKYFIKALREIDFAYCSLIINSLYDRLVPVIKYENHIIILFLLEAFKFLEDDKKDNELISLIIRAISKLLEYFKNNEGDEKIADINLVEFLEKNGFVQILDKLQYSSDEDIMNNAEFLFDNYFDHSQGENSDKININDIIEDYEKDDDNNDDND